MSLVKGTQQRETSVVVGICAMKKKVSSKPMQSILGILASTGEFTILEFPETVILNDPVESWPHPVHILICFHSDGFPLEKAEAYVTLRKPHCINNVAAQRILLDRRRVYTLLSENDIPHPDAVIVERDETGQLLGSAAENFIEGEDFLTVGQTTISKPFVEKPVDAENHNICIYYPSSVGGGIKSLFRKVGDRSSAFDPKGHGVRHDGTYMYEPFMKTQGTDIKVYTVGPEYAHAEARKSPVVDGQVNRDADGKEIRVPVVLTPTEKEIARRVCLAFGQTVCGFDLLRTTSGSYVIDVNGWSFVKGVQKYYEDAAAVLRAHMLHVAGRKLPMCSPHIRLSVPRALEQYALDKEQQDVLPQSPNGVSGKRWDHEELLAVLAVIRHGDRQPKNKMKVKTQLPEFIQLHGRWADNAKKEAKLKTPKQLQELLDLTCALLEASSNDEKEGRALQLDESELCSLRLVRMVLEEGGHFSGIYRKVQLKPNQWEPDGTVKQVLVVLKYAGSLTPAGIEQALTLGRAFRSEMYPCEEGGGKGLLRLHATQRHDFKVYSSDEGRVQMSAAAFTRGLLDLEQGQLTPLLAALVETDSAMLDDMTDEATRLISEARSGVYSRIAGESSTMDAIPSMKDELVALHKQLGNVCRELEALDYTQIKVVACGESHIEDGSLTCCSTSKPMLVLKRWQKLLDELWDPKRKEWNISKVPEIYDAVRFDLIHHPSLAPSFSCLYDASKCLNDIIIPNEYGYDKASRTAIGRAVCGRLLRKLLLDMHASSKLPSPPVFSERSLVTAVQYLERMNTSSSAQVTQSQPETGDTPKSDNALQMNAKITPSECGEEEEVEFAGLDAQYSKQHIQSPNRRVRTRLYFTSESHIQSLMNVLQGVSPGLMESNASPTPGSQGKKKAGYVQQVASVCSQEEALRRDSALDYLSHIVFRLYEDRRALPNSPERYRVEVLFSTGAAGHPSSVIGGSHTMPLTGLRPLHITNNPPTLSQLEQLIEPLARQRSQNLDNSPSTFVENEQFNSNE